MIAFGRVYRGRTTGSVWCGAKMQRDATSLISAGVPIMRKGS